MRYLLRLLCVCALGLLSVVGYSCSMTCGAAACRAGALIVELEPVLSSTYDVELVIDGTAGAFTCATDEDGWQVSDVMGDVPFYQGQYCGGASFWLLNPEEPPPLSVRITVTAQDGSWTGSNSEDPQFEAREINGPGCEPVCNYATLTIQAESGSDAAPHDTPPPARTHTPRATAIEAKGCRW